MIHSDIMGPFPQPSISKARYVLTFIDDFSRFTWVFVLKLISEVFECLIEFKALAENESGCKIKILCTNNGGEYVNKYVQKLCIDAGIQLQHTVPYTPQQNDVAERKNRSLKEMTNCMLQSKSLSPKLCAEDINCAAYIQNRVPHKSLKGTTPFECWTGKKPKVSHFRIFGSRAWAHIPTYKRKDLEPQSVECIFFGYH
jgi:transposase InsO family protein